MLKFFLTLILVISTITLLLLIIVYITSPTECFEDKVKYEQSKIIFSTLKNNKLDFDEYKKKLKNHPDLVDVTIYDKIKHLENFTVNDIYDRI